MKLYGSLIFLLIIFTFNISQNAFAGLNLDLSYWRISDAKSSFDEKISESDARNDLGNFSIQSADVQSGRPVWEIETDPSKYIFDLFYEFEDSLHRLTIGVQYAGSGNDDVNELAWDDQEKDLREVTTKPDSSSGKIKYLNYYSTYRIFPLESSLSSDNYVNKKGIDLMLTYNILDQKYTVRKATYSTKSKSFGIGLQGEHDLRASNFSVKGYLVYLPFFDFSGNGWDAQMKIRYHISDYFNVYIGGKWYDLEIETEETIKNIAQIPGFSDSEATFKGLNTELSGYTIGMSYWF